MDIFRDAASIGLGIADSIMSWQNAKKQIELGEKNLEETKKMNAWEKEKYNTTFTNQTAGIASLGDSFGKALQNKKNTHSQAQAPNTQNTSAQPQTQEAQTPQIPSEQLPTERE